MEPLLTIIIVLAAILVIGTCLDYWMMTGHKSKRKK
jgi:hypothetical protein